MLKTELDSSKHQFAFYSADLSLILNQGNEIVVNDPTLCVRIKNIVRLKQGQQCVLFDTKQWAIIEIEALANKTVRAKIIALEQNPISTTSVVCLLPVLKREHFEQAIYAAVELGATKIQPIILEKIHRFWLGPKELTRMHNIVIAAAEQSKNFSFPSLEPACSLQQACDLLESETVTIYFDKQGLPLSSLCTTLTNERPKSLCLMVGPEGDITEEERIILKEHHFVFYRLTSTTLRSVQAFSLGLGVVRSLIGS
jgi:16S rRNA (uracil1498-N3)-methyltransferase